MRSLIAAMIITAAAAQAHQLDPNGKSSWGLGVATGTYGHGIAWRGYSDEGYLQITGFLSYLQGYTYSGYRNSTTYIENPGNSFETRYLDGSLGAAYAAYMYESKNSRLFGWDTNVLLKFGGSVSNFAVMEYAFGAGVGVELFNPAHKGFAMEFVLDYKMLVNYTFYIGPAFSFLTGFNF